MKSTRQKSLPFPAAMVISLIALLPGSFGDTSEIRATTGGPNMSSATAPINHGVGAGNTPGGEPNSDGDGVPNSGDQYPNDPARWQDVPLASLAAIDISGTSTGGADATAVALDDSGNAAFAYLGSDQSGPSAKKWVNGTVDATFINVAGFPREIQLDEGHKMKAYSFYCMVNPSGNLYGTTDYVPISGDGWLGPSGYSCVNSNLETWAEDVQVYLDLYLWDSECYDCTPSGGYCGGVFYGASFGMIYHAGIRTLFDLNQEWASSTVRVIADPFQPSAMNDRGWAVGITTGNWPSVWDNDQAQLVPLDIVLGWDWTLDINDDGKVVGRATQDGFLWNNGTITYFQNLLPEKFKNQVRKISPMHIGNADASGATPILFNAESLEGEGSGSWIKRSFVLTYRPPGSASETSLARLQLAQGVSVPNVDGYHQFHSINKTGVLAALGKPTASATTTHAMLLVPADIAVDSNRDGTIRFAGNFQSTQGKPTDMTTETKPFRFWCNEDDDGTGDGAENAGGAADSADAEIKSKRDLEDFARLYVHIGAFYEELVAGSFKIGLKWSGNATGTPKVKVYKSADATGSDDYLKNDAAATAQISGTFRTALGEVSGSTPLVLPAELFAGYSEANPKVCLLFEGSGEGKGQLCITIHKADGTPLGEGPGVWLDLKQIKDMYECGYSNPVGMIAPFDRDTNFDNNTASVSSTGSSFEKPSDETKQCIIYVHGWNTDIEGYDANSATMFKRLWHRGFKGRFAALRWDTMMGGALEFESFHTSEWRGYKFGKSLQDYVTDLRSRLSGYSINVIAHSLGSAVLTSALDRGASIDNCIYTQGALSANIFDPDAPLRGGSFTTPNLAADGGYRGWLAPSAVNVVSFFNSSDVVLFGWQAYQNGKPHDASGPGQYRYTASTGRRWLEYSTGPLATRDTFDNHESMAFVAISRTAAVGAEGATGGSVDLSFNLGTLGYGTEHSPQFERHIQKNTLPYYNQMLLRFTITPNP